MQFTGRENDATGVQYNRARYYSPKLGRFISQDPLGEDASGPNLYNYTFNSPTNFTDPSGEIFFLVPLLGKCVVGAALSVGVGKALSGRKYSLGAGLLDAGLGCLRRLACSERPAEGRPRAACAQGNEEPHEGGSELMQLLRRHGGPDGGWLEEAD